MDFTTLIKKSFYFAWNNRILWVFGFLAAGSSGPGFVNPSGFNYSVPASFPDSTNEKVQGVSKVLGASDTFSSPIAAETLLLILLAVFLAVLLIVIFVTFVTNWAGSSLIYSILDRGNRRPTFGVGARAGLKYWWRFFKINLTFSLVVLGFLILLALPVGLLFLSNMRVFAIASLIVAVLVFLIFIFAFAIIGTLIITIAQRLVIHKEKGVLESIRLAGGLIKKNIGESALTWLVAAGLSFGAGFAGILLFLPIIAVVVVLFIINIWIGVVAVIPAILIAFALGGFWNAFMATYWTLFYEHLAAKEGW